MIQTFSDLEILSEAAAGEITKIAASAIEERGRFRIVLAGGSTPQRLYEQLASDRYRMQIDWGRVEFFWGDERPVPSYHEESNFRVAYESLIRRVSTPTQQVHWMEAVREDRETAAREYQQRIADSFGVNESDSPPSFDLVLLGMGADGHTASLFPHTLALEEKTRWVVVNTVPKLEQQRMTMTEPILNSARHVIFLVAGAEKAATLAEVLKGPPDPMRLPAQLIRPHFGTLVWMVENAAASRLTATHPET